jgi:hypothetical protein
MAAEETTREPVYAIRRWLVQNGYLSGIFKTRPWIPEVELAGRRWAKAVCEAVYMVYWGPTQVSQRISICGKAPGDSCACGFYGLFDVPKDWQHFLASRLSGQIFGIAEFAGDVIIGEAGVRAELGRPIHLVAVAGDHTKSALGAIAETWSDVMIEEVEMDQLVPRLTRLAQEYIIR